MGQNRNENKSGRNEWTTAATWTWPKEQESWKEISVPFASPINPTHFTKLLSHQTSREWNWDGPINSQTEPKPSPHCSSCATLVIENTQWV